MKEGDRVGVPWLYTACGCCEHCLTGWETLCEGQQNTGYSVNGGYAEYVLADPNYVGILPKNVEFDEIAPILCAGVTVYKGLKVTGARPGQWVVISGIGGLGHVAVQYAKAMGLHVVAVDVDDVKLELAKRLGAKLTINARTENPVEVVQRDIGGAHGVLVTAVSNSAFGGPSAWRGGMAPSRWSGCRRETSRRRSSTSCSRPSASPARSSAPAPICRRRWISPARAGQGDHPHRQPDNINQIFDDMRAGRIEGRIVMKM